jgi:hypothetical protein
MGGIWRFFVLSFDNNYLIITPKDLCDVFLALNQISFRDEMFGIENYHVGIVYGEPDLLQLAKKVQNVCIISQCLEYTFHSAIHRALPSHTLQTPINFTCEIFAKLRWCLQPTNSLSLPCPRPPPYIALAHSHPAYSPISPLKPLTYIIFKKRLLLISSIQSWWQSRRLPRKIKPALDPVTC